MIDRLSFDKLLGRRQMFNPGFTGHKYSTIPAISPPSYLSSSILSFHFSSFVSWTVQHALSCHFLSGTQCLYPFFPLPQRHIHLRFSVLFLRPRIREISLQRTAIPSRLPSQNLATSLSTRTAFFNGIMITNSHQMFFGRTQTSRHYLQAPQV